MELHCIRFARHRNRSWVSPALWGFVLFSTRAAMLAAGCEQRVTPNNHGRCVALVCRQGCTDIYVSETQNDSRQKLSHSHTSAHAPRSRYTHAMVRTRNENESPRHDHGPRNDTVSGKMESTTLADRVPVPVGKSMIKVRRHTPMEQLPRNGWRIQFTRIKN